MGNLFFTLSLFYILLFQKISFDLNDPLVIGLLTFVIVPLLLVGIIMLIPEKTKKDKIVKKSNNYESGSIDNFLEINILKAKKSIEKQISKTYLTGYSWVLLNSSKDFILYTFKGSNELMITKNGDVKIASYDLLSDNQSIIIKGDKMEHFEISLAKNNLLLLSKLGKDDSLLFGNYTKFKDKSPEYINGYLSKYV